MMDLSDAAYQLENLEWSKKILITWLRTYPNDLWIRYRLAIILYKSGQNKDAIRLCETIIAIDPEFIEIWKLLSILYPSQSEERKTALQRQKILDEFSRKKKGQTFGTKLSFWDNKKGPDLFTSLENNDDFDLLVSIKNAYSMLKDEDLTSDFRILRIYNRRWPNVLQFKLIIGDVMNRMGQTDEAIRLIHSTIKDDLLGQVADRIWDGKNPYKQIWLDSDSLGVDFSGMLVPEKIVKRARLEGIIASEPEDQISEKNKPNKITANTSINQEESPAKISSEAEKAEEGEESEEDSCIILPDNDKENKEVAPEKKDPTFDEEKIEVSKGISSWGNKIKIAFNTTDQSVSHHTSDGAEIKSYIYKQNIANSDERFPVYVVLSSVIGLTAKYGSNNKEFINQEMHSVADAVKNRGGWDAMVYYPDEFQSGSAETMTADMIREALINLDKTLAEKGSMIGAVLIVGGHDVIPFFGLSNPTNDDDMTIYSDAPYGSTDKSRYYEQQWQVGRIPGDDSKDPGFLLSQLRRIQKYHIQKYTEEKASQKKKKSIFTAGSGKQQFTSFGCSCAAWKAPSEKVYKDFCGNDDIKLSPTVTSANFPVTEMANTDYTYFNCHGIKGKPNWYGQKASNDSSGAPMLPVALEIGNLKRMEKTPKVIFSECCYGAEIANRNESNAISLYMLGKETQVFVGSTAIAYGALNLPLTAADLLGDLFWKHLVNGVSTGEAFRRAKKNLAEEVETSNGGLDSEIQKTLISFIFLGDPLYAVDNNADITNRMQRAKTPRQYELISEESEMNIPINSESAKKIFQNIKKRYNMSGVSDDFSMFTIKKQICQNLTGRYLAHKFNESENYIITYVRDTNIGQIFDRSIVRVTVNENGEIRKVSFSK